MTAEANETLPKRPSGILMGAGGREDAGGIEEGGR